MSGSSSRQSQMVADEMFPDGPGPLDFVDVEDGVRDCLDEGQGGDGVSPGQGWGERSGGPPVRADRQ